MAGTKAPAFIEDEEERDIHEDKTEVVVFLIPNVSHLMPSDEEWEKTRKSYSDSFQRLFSTSEGEKVEEVVKTEQTAATENLESTQASESALEETQDSSHAEQTEGEPTHYSKLDINSMKVNTLAY